MSFTSLLSTLATLFLLLICGFLCRKWKIIDSIASKKLSHLILSVGQPMMIIGALSKAEYSKENIRLAWKCALIGLCVHTFVALFAFFFCKLLKKEPEENKIFEFSLVFGNVGFLGFPILDSIFGGSIGSFMGSFYFISFHVFLWTWGILIFARGRSDIKLTPKKALLNFGTVPCAIGILLYFCKPLFELPAFCSQFLSYLGGLCTPISVLITGALLATFSAKEFFASKKLYLQSGVKLLLLPFLCIALAHLCGLRENYLYLVAAMTGVPSAATATMLAEKFDTEPKFASGVIGMTSVFSTATLPLVMLFAQFANNL